MPRINVYIVCYNNEVIEEVERTLSQFGRIVEKNVSKIVPQFYHYRLETSDKEDVEKALKNYLEKDLISWYKIEETFG